jgi:hypothetical protein
LSWVHGEGAQAGPFSFHKISTEDQPADVLTKPLAWELFVKHRKWLLGW